VLKVPRYALSLSSNGRIMSRTKSEPYWPRNARIWLSELIRYAVYNSDVRPYIGGQVQRLFEAILSRWENTEAALNTESANKFVQAKDAKSEVPVVAGSLRRRIRRIARQKLLAPFKIDFPDRAYRLQVCGAPPAELLRKFPKPAIGLVFPHSADWFFGKLVGGALQACEERGYSLVVKCSEDKAELERKHVEELAATTEGLLIVPVSSRFRTETLKAIEKNNVILVDRYLSGIDVMCVRGDDVAGGRLAGNYFKNKSCRRVLVVFQKPREGQHIVSPLYDRMLGCQEVYGENAIELDAVGRDEKGGYRALQVFHKQRRGNRGPITKHDGIFALTDKLALGCRRFLAEKTIPVNPANVVGYEGQDFGRYLTPPLVSVKLDDYKMGRVAAEALIEKIEHRVRPDQPLRRLLPVSLVGVAGTARSKSTRKTKK
jgi:LacI family transcriptional regulator